MHSRLSPLASSNYLGQKTFSFASNGGGLLPVHHRTNRTTVLQTAVRQFKNKYSQKLRQTYRSSRLWILLVLLLAFLVLLRSAWFTRSEMNQKPPNMDNSSVIPKQSFSKVIGESHTDFMLLEYCDQIMIVVTQIGKLGTLLQARQDEHSMTYSVDVLLGKRDDPLLEICGRQLIEKLALGGCSKNLMLWLGLETSVSSFTIQGIIAAIVEGFERFKTPRKPNESS